MKDLIKSRSFQNHIRHANVTTQKLQAIAAHYQGVARIVDELRIEAEADDGTIEAVSARNHPIFAVQWHPECALDDAVSCAVFSIFADLLH